MLNGMLIVLMVVSGMGQANDDSSFAWASLGTDSGSYQMFVTGGEIDFGFEDNPAEKEEGRDYYLLNGGIDFSSIQVLFSLEIEALEGENVLLLFKAITVMPREKGGVQVRTHKYVLN